MREHGRILGVTEKPIGSVLVGDTPFGATTLTVVDAAEFEQSGWLLSINGQVIAYRPVDDDAATIPSRRPWLIQRTRATRCWQPRAARSFPHSIAIESGVVS